ncbi:Low temperature viability protein [Trinorchestia longiramus]|nr:Low temperature viability protein [Trinorchestia longiramus]
MGKRRFIDPKKDVVHTIVLSGKKLPGLAGALLAQSEASKKPKPSKTKAFQLRCDIPAEENSQLLTDDAPTSIDVASRGTVRFSDDFPALGEEPLSSKQSVKRQFLTREQPDSSHGQMETPGLSAWQTSAPSTSTQEDLEDNDQSHDPYKYSSYGIYFDDDYDYGQHLRDPNDWPLADAETEFYTLPKEHPQAHKKNGPKKLSSIPETFSYEAPANDGTTSQSQTSIKASEEPYDELFDNADDGELPDDIMHFLDGDDCSNYSDEWEDEDDETVDSDGHMDVSDDEELNSGSVRAQLHSLAVQRTPQEDQDSAPLQEQEAAHQDQKAVHQDQKTNSNLDSFFDRIPGVEEEEGEEPPKRVVTPPTLQSSRGAKVVTAEYERFNEKFDALLLRDYQDGDVGDAKLDVVDGYLADDASQVSQFAQELRSVKYRDERVALVGPLKEQETEKDSQMRLQALQYCKTYKESKPKAFEVCVPDPSAMKYNVTNVPTVLNKNMPIIIKNELPFLSRRKKGLSVKDLKQHDAELNTPHREVDEEVQTYKTMLSELSYRPPDETTEEHRQRKAAVKEIRRARREEKKLNSQAHKDMILHTSKVNMNAKHCKGVPLL